MRRAAILIAVMLCVLPVGAQSGAQSAPSWKSLDFLIGTWTGVAGEKDTPLGAGQGGFSFEQQLEQKIIVRRNTAAYDSGQHHDDLMIIYLEAPGSAPRAIYFDSEGHVIRYNLKFPAAGSVVFESEDAQPGPRYRLSYRMSGAVLDGQFEVAAPGAEYKSYLAWKAKRAGK